MSIKIINNDQFYFTCNNCLVKNKPRFEFSISRGHFAICNNCDYREKIANDLADSIGLDLELDSGVNLMRIKKEKRINLDHLIMEVMDDDAFLYCKNCGKFQKLNIDTDEISLKDVEISIGEFRRKHFQCVEE